MDAICISNSLRPHKKIGPTFLAATPQSTQSDTLRLATPPLFVQLRSRALSAGCPFREVSPSRRNKNLKLTLHLLARCCLLSRVRGFCRFCQVCSWRLWLVSAWLIFDCFWQVGALFFESMVHSSCVRPLPQYWIYLPYWRDPYIIEGPSLNLQLSTSNQQ